MKRSVNKIICVLGVMLLIACQPKVPKEYIQPDDMEDILYDYFISQGVAQHNQTNPAEGDYKRELYFDAVLKKHEVSRADFDSSLVYYYTRADRFVKICKQVQDRLGEDAIKYGASVDEVERFTVTSLTGDTANIWNGGPSKVMIPYAPYNHLQFSIKADTAFRKGDSFMLTFQSNFLYQSGSKDAVAYLAVKYSNDSVATSNVHFSTIGNTQLRMSGCEEDIKEISGFIYLGQGYEATNNLRLLVLNNIQLIRFHRPKEEPVKEILTSGSKADSLQQLPDSMRPQHHRLGERPLPASNSNLQQ